MSKKQIIIFKANGDQAIFSRAKLAKSLRRSGAASGLAEDVALQVENKIKNGDNTQEIYRLAFDILKREDARPTAARYSLKKAIMQLGPTGFPFENFVAKILQNQGLKTKVGIIIQGKCVLHEVDVEAIDKDSHYFLECKFHNQPGTTTDVKVALYVHSRFEDIMGRINKKGSCHPFHQAWVVTNTKLTKDAIKYGECMNIKMMGWRYPEDGGVEALVEDSGLHPLTCLTILNNQEKVKLLENNIVLCQEIMENLDFIKSLGMGDNRLKQLLKEVEALCAGKYSVKLRENI